MKKNSIIILLLFSCFFHSCGNGDTKLAKEKIYPVSTLKPAPQTSLDHVSSKITVAEDSGKKLLFNKKKSLTVTKPIIVTQLPPAENITEKTETPIKNSSGGHFINFVNLRKIFSGSKIGETMSQKDLTQNFNIPKEAVKLVKSVTRTAEDELAVKWRSTWLVEKVSDAKLEDGNMKVRFQANKLFMSGKAIGIKYNRKIYNDLIIIGHSAYIPSVKGYHWHIGK